jgi:hypothetical protein
MLDRLAFGGALAVMRERLKPGGVTRSSPADAAAFDCACSRQARRRCRTDQNATANFSGIEAGRFNKDFFSLAGRWREYHLTRTGSTDASPVQ